MGLIKKKFAIKCTTGYSINALLVDPTDPIEIIKRLMIGSEGTLGFVSQATYNTVPDYENKASCFIMYDHVEDACRGAAVLRRETQVDAVEMFDRASLRECESNKTLLDIVPGVKEAGPWGAALLIECRGKDEGAPPHQQPCSSCAAPLAHQRPPPRSVPPQPRQLLSLRAPTRFLPPAAPSDYLPTPSSPLLSLPRPQRS